MPLIVVFFFVFPFVVLVVIEGFKAIRRSWLDQNGVVISATVTGIEWTWWRSEDQGYIVTAQWTDPNTGSTYFFRKKTGNFLFGPGYLFGSGYSEGDQMQVVLDPSNPSNYYIQE